MSVPIKFVPDMTEVRAQFDRLTADARRGIPLGFAGGGGGFGGTPTVAGAFGSAVAPRPIAGFGTPAPNYGVTFPAGPTISGAFASPGAPGGFAPSGGGGSGFGVDGFGGGARVLGYGTALNYISHAVDASRLYNTASLLAGSDQRAQLAATMDYRKRLIEGSGFIGRGVGFFEDPTGAREAEVSSIGLEADARDAQTQNMRRSANFSDTLRGRANVATETDPIEKRRRASEEAHKAEMKQIEEERREREKANEKIIESHRKTLDSARDQASGGKLGRFVSGVMGDDSYEQWTARDNATISAERGDLSGKSKARYDEDVANANRIFDAEKDEIRRSQAYGRDIAQLRSAGAIREAALVGQGNSIAARRESLVNQNNLELLESAARRDDGDVYRGIGMAGRARLAALDAATARDVRLGIVSERGGLDVTNALIEHNPLEARIKGIQARTAVDLESPLAVFSSDYRRLVQSRGEQEVNLAKQEDREHRDLRDTALANRGAELAVLLRDDRYAGQAAQSLAIRNAADLKVKELQLTNGGHANDNAIRQVLQNAQTEQQVLVKQLLRTFDTASVNIGQTDLSGGGHGADIKRTLDDIARNTGDTSRKLDGIGRAQ